MIRRVGGANHLGGAPSNLLDCFPTRSHLALMPKPIGSPSRPLDRSKRHPSSRPASSRNRASPLTRAKTVKQMSPEMDEEPTSPKVTCAGQIRVRQKTRPIGIGQSWLSTKKKQTWLDTLGLKRDIMQFFTTRLRFNLGCFSSPSVDCTTDDEDEEEVSSTESGAIFSKWFMVLDQESKDGGLKDEEQDEAAAIESAPPANALLLMRCRSAPAKAKEWLEAMEEDDHEEEMVMVRAKRVREEEKEKERLVLMSYAPDFFKVSMDIVKETWIDGGAMDSLARSRSWKR